MSYAAALNDLKNIANPTKAAQTKRFFKTGPGEYSEHDQFIGVYVPNIRKIASRYQDLPQTQIKKLLTSPIHEVRLLGLLILVRQFETGDQASQEEVYDFYLKQTAAINNWDLVDLTAPKIPGYYLLKRDKTALIQLSESDNMWERRIAIVSTLTFIKHQKFSLTLKLAKKYLDETHDLMHKATGWMLREVGKQDVDTLKKFLDQHVKRMPRTMLRYAIERFDKPLRQHYMQQ